MNAEFNLLHIDESLQLDIILEKMALKKTIPVYKLKYQSCELCDIVRYTDTRRVKKVMHTKQI